MRVISGSAKRLQLKAVEGMDTRPTTDRIKETLFNVINPYIQDCMFLDLFSGSGGIGIEALSRGAKEAVFVEQNPKAMMIIRENLKHTNLDGRAKLMSSDSVSALHKLNGAQKFDYIYMDPPYNQELEKKVLEYIGESDLLYEDGIIIVEASNETEFDYLDAWGFVIIKEKKYKTNKHVFIEMVKGEDIC